MFFKKNKVLIIAVSASLVAFLALALFAAFLLFGNTRVTNINGLYRAIARTSTKHNEEIETFKETNKVFFNWNKAITEGSQHTLSAEDIFTLELIDSKDDKRFDMYLDVPDFLDNRAEFYLQDEEIILGIEGSEYLSSTSGTLEDDLISLAKETGSQDTVEQIEAFFEDLVFSYDELFPAQQTNIREVAFTKRYTEVMKDLLNSGEFSVEDETFSYDDNDENTSVRVQNVTLGFTNANIADWIENDLLPTLEDDEDFQLLFDSFQTGYSLSSYTEALDFSEFLLALKDTVADLRDLDNSYYQLNFIVYKGHVLETRLSVEIDEIEVSIAVAAKGATNLLDDISIIIVDPDGDNIIISAKGNHIDGPIFHSTVYYEDYWDETTLTIDWNTDEKANNFEISGVDSAGDTIDFVMTFATKDKGILAEFDFDETRVAYQLAALEQLNPLPSNTVPLASLDLMELYNMYADLFESSYYNYDDYDWDDEEWNYDDYDGGTEIWDDWTDEEWETFLEESENWTDEEWDEWLSTIE